MSAKKKPRLSWTVLPWAYALFTFFTVVLNGTNGQVSRQPVAFVDGVLASFALIIFMGTAVVIVTRRPRNLIGWLLMAPSTAFVFDQGFKLYRLVNPYPASATFTLVSAWFSNWSWLLLIFPLLLILLLFPTGKPPSPRWRWVGAFGLIWAAGFVMIATFQQSITHFDGGAAIPNPLGFLTEPAVNSILAPWQFGLLALTVLCITAFLVRFRQGTPVEKNQIKLVLLACSAFALVYIGGFAFNQGGSSILGDLIFTIFFWVTITSIPLAISVALLRYRLWDIDVIIRRTLFYGALTLTLGVVYFGSVVVLQAVFQALTGESRSPIATVISTLAIAALFNPLRRRIQSDIDRRFYRRRYDAEKTLEAFATSLRNEVDLEQLSDHLVSVVRETMQPESASLWLRQPENRPWNPKS